MVEGEEEEDAVEDEEDEDEDDEATVEEEDEGDKSDTKLTTEVIGPPPTRYFSYLTTFYRIYGKQKSTARQTVTVA